MRWSVTQRILIASLVGNAVAMGFAVRAIHLRGGWQYLKDRLISPATNQTPSSDEVTYRHRQSLFACVPAPSATLVFVGDSLTGGCEWSEFFPGALNRGIGGDTSEGLLRRLPAITRLRPRAIFLMIGVNDMTNARLTPERTVANIQAAITAIRRSSPGTIVYLQDVLPTWDSKQNAYIQRVNLHLPALADGKSVIHIGLYNAFLAGTLLNPRFTLDGTHLNGEGYLLWKSRIERHIVPRL